MNESLIAKVWVFERSYTGPQRDAPAGWHPVRVEISYSRPALTVGMRQSKHYVYQVSEFARKEAV